MTVEIKKGRAKGSIRIPSSKSISHRLLISAALADGLSILEGIDDCQDITATVNALKSLGANIETNGSTYYVQGIDPSKCRTENIIYPNESGSTLRFLIPIATLNGNEAVFRPKDGLLRRPMDIYEDIYKNSGLKFQKDDKEIRVMGKLHSGNYVVRGDVSSQFITGLIFALPHNKEDSRIIITEPFESRSYVLMTIDCVRKFGIDVYFENDTTIYIKGNQRFRATSLTADGDYSSAAFIDALNLLGSDVTIKGLYESSLQGDKIYKDIYKKLSCGFSTIDISNCPDLGPILFALASELHGAKFIGTKRLKIKESDRVRSMAEELQKLGAKLEIGKNEVIITKAPLHPPKDIISSHNDHRICMSMAILLTLYGGKISGAECIEKSYPDFFNHLKELSLDITEI